MATGRTVCGKAGRRVLPCNKSVFIAACAFAMSAVAAASDVDASSGSKEGVDSLFEEPVARTSCGGVPVKAFGQTWVYAGAPDLADDESFQEGNSNPRVKIVPKTSAETGFNYMGACSMRMPRLLRNHELPSESVNLIDGDPSTAWMSHGQTRPDIAPVWVRIDLPRERKIAKVVIRKTPKGRPRSSGCRTPFRGAVEVGRGIPAALAVQVSRDAYKWETVFDGQTGDTDDNESWEVAFPVCTAKQIRIVSRCLVKVEYLFFAFSAGDVEVHGEGDVGNVATLAQGANVTVSSTQHNEQLLPMEYFGIWPLHWDSGFKWARVGFHDDPINWHCVEREKGVLKVDPVTDASVTALACNGVSVIMNLGYGNRLYSGPQGRNRPQLPEFNWDTPLPPTTPEALAAWERYATFVVRHFADRVAVFEIWNEFNYSNYWGADPGWKAYEALVARTIPIIRREAPRAKVMLGSLAHYHHWLADDDRWLTDESIKKGDDVQFPALVRFAKEVDVVGFHPFYAQPPQYTRKAFGKISRLAAFLKKHGFAGELYASEWSVNCRYPEVDEETRKAWQLFNQSEQQRAKEMASYCVSFAGRDVASMFCTLTGVNYGPSNLSLFRRPVSQDPCSSLQPEPAYYVLRNLATIMGGLRAADWKAEVTGIPAERHPASYGFYDGLRRVAAVYYVPDDRGDGYRHIQAEVTLPFEAVGDVFLADPLNGVRQKANAEVGNGKTTLHGVAVGDVPLFIEATVP